MEELIAEYVKNNPLTDRVVLVEGDGYTVQIIPNEIFAEQPIKWRTDNDLDSPSSEPCGSGLSDTGWICTRRKGHTLPHVAGFNSNEIIQVW